MISAISFKNYKAFKEGVFELKPITILLGANSVGKSSLLQLLLMIKQTVGNDKEYQSALKLNGESVGLGENKNIFHNQDTNLPLEISFNINNFNLKRIKRDLESSIEEIYISLERIFSFLTEKREDSRFVNRTYFYGKNIEMNHLKMLDKILSLKKKINNQIKSTEKEVAIDELFHRTMLGSRYIKNIDNFYSKKDKKIVIDIGHYKKIYNLLNSIYTFSNQPILLTYQFINNKKNDLEINKIEIKNNEKIILGYEYINVVGGKRHSLYSDILIKKIPYRYVSRFGNSIIFKKLDIFSKKDESIEGGEDSFSDSKEYKRSSSKIEENIFIETIFNIFKKPIKSLNANFSSENINYVSPLRAFPRRYYFLDEANVSSSLNTIDGNQLTEILKDDKAVKKEVDNWLKKFGLKVDVEQLQNVIHNIKINQHGLSLDITDVGFGISQVLPVIVQGFLSKDDSLTIVEQPEIHLHPNMQADLADLFIQIVQQKRKDELFPDDESGKKLLIETHSEYLLKRLRRRMAEGKISTKDVAIYFLHPKDESSQGSGKIEKIKISSTGAFKWPRGFYSDDLEDTIEFLKHQK